MHPLTYTYTPAQHLDMSSIECTNVVSNIPSDILSEIVCSKGKMASSAEFKKETDTTKK